MRTLINSGQNTAKHLSFFAIILCSLLTTGCASLGSSIGNQVEKQVSVSDLSRYWIVKEGVLDWSILFDEQDISGDFTANFKINSLGEIQHIDLTDISESLKTETIKMESFSRQSFISAKSNYSNQPVSVTARVELNL